jgi:hypothetical protein
VQQQQTKPTAPGSEEALDGTAKGDALVPIQTAAMLERKATPELSFTNGRRAGHPADPPSSPQTAGLTFSAWPWSFLAQCWTLLRASLSCVYCQLAAALA